MFRHTRTRVLRERSSASPARPHLLESEGVEHGILQHQGLENLHIVKQNEDIDVGHAVLVNQVDHARGVPLAKLRIQLGDGSQATVRSKFSLNRGLREAPEVARLSTGQVQANRLKEAGSELFIRRTWKDRVTDFGLDGRVLHRILVMHVSIAYDRYGRESLGQGKRQRILEQQARKALLGPGAAAHKLC